MKEHTDVRLIQHFLIQGIGCCFCINSYSTLHFYVDAAVYSTSVCLGIHGNKVYVSNNKMKRGTIFAWGCAGNDSTGSYDETNKNRSNKTMEN